MKYFTDSYLNDYNILRNAKIGFEFEFFSKLSYHSTCLYLTERLGVNVKGIKEYHPNEKPEDGKFLLTPDLSGGFSCAELITNPMEYSEARIMLSKICSILQEISETTDRTGIHINISFNDSNIESINPIKLILNIDESKIYEYFPDRENNIYCKSVKNILPYKGYDYATANSNILYTSLNHHSENSKYYGINFTCIKDGRIEFRYIGGEDYQHKIPNILDLLDYFIISTYNSLDTNLSEEENKTLRRYLEKNIKKYKSLSRLENFLSRYPTISIEVDKQNSFEINKTYYPTFYDELYEFITNTKNLEECIINFDTETRQLEVIDANIKCIGILNNLVFIDCNINGGDYNKCEFYSTSLNESILNNSLISDSTLKDCKLLESKVIKETILNDCYFTEGLMDGIMNSGIFRSGKIGENAVISHETKMLTRDENFFNFNGLTHNNTDISKKNDKN